MKYPTNIEGLRDEIIKCTLLYSVVKEQRINQLLHILRGADASIVSEAVIQIFELNNVIAQEMAGRILETYNPETALSVETILKRCLRTWNKSVEQLPFWLVNCFGTENVSMALTKAEAVCQFEAELNSIKSMKWWLHHKV